MPLTCCAPLTDNGVACAAITEIDHLTFEADRRRAAGKLSRDQAQEQLTTAATMYRKMDTRSFLAQAEAEQKA